MFSPDNVEGALMTAASAIVKKRSKLVVCETDPATRRSLQESVEWYANTAAAMVAGQHTALNALLPAVGGYPGDPRAPRTRGGDVSVEEAKRMDALSEACNGPHPHQDMAGGLRDLLKGR